MSASRPGVGLARNWVACLVSLGLVALALGRLAEPLSGLLTHRVVDTVKPVLAAAATLLLLGDQILRRCGLAGRGRALRDVLLIAVAGASALAWWNLMQFHYPRYIHFSDTYHYYIGAKYFRELHYTRLYACTAVADLEAGPRTGVRERLLRNLETNELESTEAVLADPEACKRHFTAERWAAFSHDVGWFRSQVPRARWHAIQRDHGYNPPPSWAIAGATLANLSPASDLQIRALCLLDPLLLAGMWTCIAWAFGWRVLAVAAVFWGTNLFGVFGWTGGAFLRQGWLATAIAGICCLRKHRPAAAGALLATSAMLRVFPLALLVALGLRAVVSMGRRRRLAPETSDLRLALGALLAVGVMVPLSAVAVGGLGTWSEFVANSRVHLATPLKNHVGLATLLAYDASHVERRVQGPDAVRRYQTWRDARHARFGERIWVYRACVLAFVVLLGLAVRDQPPWVAAVLGVGLIPVGFELTNYYYAVLLAYGLLSDLRPEVGVGLCGISALTWVIVDLWHWRDEIMVWASALVVACVVLCTAIFVPPSAGGARARRC